MSKMPSHLLVVVVICAVVAARLNAAEPLVIADFEDGAKPFESGEVVAEHATHGQKAVKIEAGKWLGAGSWAGLPKDWSQYDIFRMDVFNPNDKPVKMSIQIRDQMGDRGYWAWHNRYTAIAQGQNIVQFAVADIWRGEILRRDIPGFVDTKNITMLTINADGPVFVDYIRLENFAAPKVEVQGLKAFDVGKSGTPGFPGFTALTEKDLYSKEKGFGWTHTNFSRMDDRIHPDNLFRDNLGCYNCELAIDRPNGKYRVHMQLEDPGYWEFMQNYNKRTVSSEGQTVIDETMDAPEFMKRYFRNQDAEDFPENDPFDKYVEPRHPWHTFDTDVTDGQLNLALRSDDTYGNTLSAIILYPVSQVENGVKFLEYVKAVRRFDWSQCWKPVSKAAEEPVFAGKTQAEAQANGFVLFSLSPYADLDYARVPGEAETLDGLSLAAALGEYEPACFGMKPAKALGKVEVTISDFSGPGGAVIPAGNAELRVGRYRFTRYAGHQSGLYEVAEKELRLFNRTQADELRCDNFMARRFWLTVRVPDNAKDGMYTASITVKAEKGGVKTVPVRLNVLPFRLPEPEHLFSLYGIGVLPVPYYPSMKTDYPKNLEIVLRDLRAHGVNYIGEHFGGMTAAVTWQDGKAVITNADGFEKQIALVRSLGFRDGTIGMDGGCSLEDLASGKEVRGLPKEKFIEGWHKTLTDYFKARGWPHPYFCYGDEPNLPETLNKLTAANKAVHAVSPDIWMGIAYHVESPESYELLKSLDVHHLKAFLKVDDFLLARKYAKQLLNCNMGMTREAFGLREWRAAKERKTDGCITYAYTGNHVDIYYDLDAREGDYNQAPPRLDGTLATCATWERIREGIDDFKYALAIERLAGDPASAQGKKAAAEQLLKEAYDIGGIAGDGGFVEKATAWRAKAQQVLNGK